MKKILLWSIVAGLIVLAYFIFALFFTWLFQETANRRVVNTPTPEPTFTPTPTPTTLVVAGVTPLLPTPDPTATPSSTPTQPPPTPTPAPPTATPTPVRPQVVSSITVNVRSGPGTDYPVIGTMLPDSPLPVTGRNEPASWWQVQLGDGSTGWVAGSVAQARAVEGVPVVQTPAPPEPTATPIPPTPTRPLYQFEPTGWWSDTNYGLTRFLGTITDVEGNPVNGVYVEAQCGSYRVLSNPSGPVPNPQRHDSAYDPPGFYDITLARYPIACKWFLTVVTSSDGVTAGAPLSQAIEVETTIDESIIVANWRKNW